MNLNVFLQCNRRVDQFFASAFNLKKSHIIGKSASVDRFSRRKEKERDLSSMTKTLIPTENSTTNRQHKNFTKIFDNTKIRTVRLSNNGHPTGVVKPVCGYTTFRLTAIAV